MVLRTCGSARLFSIVVVFNNISPMGRETGLVPVVWEKSMPGFLPDSLLLKELLLLDQFPVFAGSKPGRMRINMTGPLPPSAPVRILTYPF